MFEELNELQNKIGYTFQNPALLRMALAHSSYANEQFGDRLASNERLEFLGDSVLSLIACRHLYQTYPDMPEGRLTSLRKNLVWQQALAEYATQIGLGAFLLLGKGEEKDGREKPKILEDAFEALLGALYLDTESIDRVAEFLLPFLQNKLQQLKTEPDVIEDYKTKLQQYVQQTPGEKLSYDLIAEEGPDNAKIFTVQACINSNPFGEGRGSSKKEAEQNAAKEALKLYIPNR